MIKHSIQEYIASLITLISELKKDVERQVNYKIVDIKTDAQDNTILMIKLSGKQAVVACSPDEIVSHDGFLEGFSKQDVRTITYFATKQLHRPSIELIGQHIDCSTNETIFQFNDRKEGAHFNKPASEVSCAHTLLRKLDQLDAHIIGYAACAEAFERERRELDALREEEK